MFQPRAPTLTRSPLLQEALLPLAEPAEELPVAAALGDEHEVPRGDVGLVQGHEPLVVQRPQHFILLQDPPLALTCIGHNLGHERSAGGILPAHAHYTKSAPAVWGDSTGSEERGDTTIVEAKGTGVGRAGTQMRARELNPRNLGLNPSSVSQWLCTLGKPHNLSNLSFPICEMGDDDNAVASSLSYED